VKHPEQCEVPGPCDEWGGVCPDPIRINELMADNDGAWIDEARETDDWVELVNTGSEPLSLLGYAISDDEDSYTFLPSATLAAGEVVLLWADATRSQGPDHMPFKLDPDGETLFLWAPDGRLVDRVSYPPLWANQSLARQPHGTGEPALCRWATPGRANGESCTAPPPPELPDDVTFAPFIWPEPYPAMPMPLALNELALDPAAFVEVQNTSPASVDLAGFSVRVAAHAPGLPWPDAASGVALSWPTATLSPGERAVLAVDAAATAAIAATEEFEGVVTLFDPAAGVVDRVDFMAWPQGAALARAPDGAGAMRFCATLTAGAANVPCDPLTSRPVHNRLRHLYTAGDFAALAAGGSAVGMDAVKVIVDMDAGDVVHLVGGDWDLHYTFVRELIDGLPHLDRCDPTESQIFYQGWAQFSQEQYFAVETRRYLLGTLLHYASNGLETLEFVTGDRIIAPQMERAFFAIVPHLDRPTAWALRPLDSRQVDEMRLCEGHLPIVGPNTPFRDVVMQPLTEGLAYGILTFVPVGELFAVPLGWQVVVITDQVPNDIPLVGGLITETFQTPLAHVNVLSRSRGTPNMALVDAHLDPRLAPLLGQLVRFEVTAGSFTLQPASPTEAEAFWAERMGTGDPLVPRLDTSVRGVVPLAGRSLADLPVIGAKAAGLAELGRVNSVRSACPGPVNVPRFAAAVALVHSLEHYQACGATTRLAELAGDPTFAADPRYRAEKLVEVQAMIRAWPVDPTLLAAVESYVSTNFGQSRVRLRSSSNTEDLEGFNGAGLYTSVAASLGDANDTLADALLEVWASLYNPRAYDERRLFRVDESAVAMGILLHRAYVSEEANVVAISRNIFEPIRGDQYYVNAQAGEASVTNPAPGIVTEQSLYNWGRTPRIETLGLSNLPNARPVLTAVEVDQITCVLRAVHDHFRAVLDPEHENRWFAVDTEVKLEHGTRVIAFKQARPYVFGHATLPTDCREF
jgi:hypothetical protein